MIRVMRIGLIADTHGQLHPSVGKHFAGVELILHAGDIGSPKVLEELAAIAPVQAVAGNMDRPPLSTSHPKYRFLELQGVSILLVHRAPSRVELDDLARTWRRRPRVVVHGHTHCPRQESRSGILFVNPGAAGGRGDTFSVAILTLQEDDAPSVVFCDL